MSFISRIKTNKLAAALGVSGKLLIICAMRRS